jgi:hypothetical protein
LWPTVQGKLHSIYVHFQVLTAVIIKDMMPYSLLEIIKRFEETTFSFFRIQEEYAKKEANIVFCLNNFVTYVIWMCNMVSYFKGRTQIIGV